MTPAPFPVYLYVNGKPVPPNRLAQTAEPPNAAAVADVQRPEFTQFRWPVKAFGLLSIGWPSIMTATTVTLRCKRCNSPLQTDSHQPKPNDMVRCPRHRNIGSYKDAVNEAEKLLLAQLEGEAVKMFRKAGFKAK